MPQLQLTAEQQSVVDAPSGHYVIRAVAGSGKTTTLAYRIRHLLETGIDAKRILVLMFNKSAQLDFTQKLRDVIPGSSPKPEVRTFHAMGFRLYKRFIELGALPSFHPQVLREREIQFQLLQLAGALLSPDQMKEFKRYKKDHLDMASNFIDQCKGQLESPHVFFKESGLEDKFSYLPALFERFEEWRKSNHRISYSDMLYDPVNALINQPDLQKIVRDKMEAVLVDEYQDTNDIQHTLLGFIAGTRAKVTIVGDPDQTIYEFRGAKPQYMVSGFSDEYPESTALYLSHSFRYGHQVALLANQLISHSPYADGRLCIPGRKEQFTSAKLYEGTKEHATLLQDLHQLAPEQRDQSAILLRVWSQSAALELALLKSNIDYRIQGHSGIFGTEELGFVKSLLELAAGKFATFTPHQRFEKLQLFCRFPHVGIGEHKLSAILQTAAEHETRFGYALLHNIPDSLARIQRLKLQRLARALSAIENCAKSNRQLFRSYIDETHLYSELKTMGLSNDASAEQAQILMNLIEFICSSQPKPDQALDELIALEMQTRANEGAALTITTIHRAKGLEWDHVFLPGLEKDNFLGRASKKGAFQEQIASERRLLYVGLTRAKESVNLYSVTKQDEQRLALVDEMCFAESQKLASFIEKKQKGQCVYNKPVSPMTHSYATRFNCEVTAPKAPKPKTNSNAEPWKNRQVKHSLLGLGEVVKEELNTFTVEFDGQQRTFSKQHSRTLFTPA